MQLNPYLVFNGQCEEAFRFYEQCLGGKIGVLSTYAGTPAESHVSPEWRDRVLHVSLAIGDQVLMGSDAPPEQYKPMQGFSVSLNFHNAAEAERTFHALAANGTVQMPFQQTFWAERFGMLVDRFGVPWIVNSERAG